MNRRTLIGAAAAVAAFPVLSRVASAQTSLKTKNVVFVHGLFADGSCWSRVIARLQQKGINCTSVQHSLTSLHEASEAARRAIAAQSGPTVLVGHSFSGMIVSEVGLDQDNRDQCEPPGADLTTRCDHESDYGGTRRLRPPTKVELNWGGCAGVPDVSCGS